MDDQKAGPDEDRAYRAMVRATAEIATQCALALAGHGMLTDERSRIIEKLLLDVGHGAFVGGGQIAETVFSRAAEVLRLRRQASESNAQDQ